MEELPYHLDYIKEWKKPLIIYCMDGLRSQKVYDALKREGIEVYDALSQERVMSFLKVFNYPGELCTIQYHIDLREVYA